MTPIPAGIVASARVASGSGYSAAVLADSPFGYWTHNETSGATSADTTGTYPATWSGTYMRNASPLIASGKAVSLGGAGYALASLGSYAPAAITLESVISISTTGTYKMILARDNGSANPRMFQFRVTDSQALELIWWTVSSGPHFATSASGVVSSGIPCHVAATYAAGSAFVYKNGVQVASGSSANAALQTGTLSLALGVLNDALDLKFAGTLDEQAAYPTALSAARILAHATAGGF